MQSKEGVGGVLHGALVRERVVGKSMVAAVCFKFKNEMLVRLIALDFYD